MPRHYVQIPIFTCSIEMLSNESYLDKQKNRRIQFKRVVINTVKELKEYKPTMSKHLN